MYYVYVLFSPNYSKIYIGFTADLKNRMDSHNIYSTKGFTKNYRPWEIIHTESFNLKREAILREKQLKSASGRDFIWKLVKEKYDM